MELKYYINNRHLYKYDDHTEQVIAPEDKPIFHFGERPTLTMAFPDGVLYAGMTLVVSVDIDMRHGQDGTTPMILNAKTVTEAEAEANEVSMEIVTNTQRYYELTNLLPKNGSRMAAFGIYLREVVTGEYTTMCADSAYCFGIVSEDVEYSNVLSSEWLDIYINDRDQLIVEQVNGNFSFDINPVGELILTFA